MSATREQFGSRIGFILAAAGSAVGIGNMVGFPVAATKNGGGAFLLIYAIFVAFICLPVMLAEMSVGRHSRKDPLGAYSTMSNNHNGWKVAGWLSIITPFMIAVFYLVITVWIFGYLYQSVTGNLDMLAAPDTFGSFINGVDLIYYSLAVLAIIYLILQGGVKRGIEKAAKIMMPALFIMLVALVIFVLTLDNAFEGVKYYVIPDFSKINASVVSAALSQAFFSLSLGMGIMITYGSYLDSKSDVAGSAKMVALLDTAVAFIAGLLILPAVFSFNPNIDTSELSDSSVGMIFTFLPKIFLALQTSIGYTGASAVASLFFVLVFFAAITSMVSIFEVPVAALMEEKKFKRRKALGLLGLLLVVMGVMAATSFGVADFFTQFTQYAGQSKSFFDLIIDVFYDTILPLNGLLICIFVMYRWKKINFTQEMDVNSQSQGNNWFIRYVNFSVSTFIPIILLAVFVNTVALKYFGSALIG
ncbi:sodium-dependent transporter [Paraglaciecola aquimarina]|uniref:Sodium-dependent transporter n=1 Tax=Paraglaciecola algarum TaxID=3050085 RepID=A0ABS9D314_9ALTE|nr:sodium-dependent transporter [Paraglaciecola sp. G1-23]MCF2947309.1 sodium-dependent transporter [Paraglaciecola sp. G1-23]